MTASEKCKAAGLKSLAELGEITGVAISTLNDWFRTKPKLFETVVIGAAELKHRKTSYLFVSVLC